MAAESAPYEIVAPSFPPLLSGRIVMPGVDPFEAACEAAAEGEDAGAVFWSDERAVIRVAIVLAPDTARAQALAMHLAAAVALNDSLGALAPAETGLRHLWPDGVEINGALAGVVRTRLADCGTDEVPGWMVTGVVLSRSFPADTPPGALPDYTALSEEGCADLTPTRLIESWSRHFLTWVHRWEEDGPRPLFDAWLYRAAGRDADVDFLIEGKTVRGRLMGLCEGGEASLRIDDGAVATRSLEAALVHPRRWPPAAFAHPADPDGETP